MATCGAAIVLAGSFLPWLDSGARSRSSYDLLDIVDRLGFSPDGVVGWAVRLWPLLPLLLVTTVVTHHLGTSTPWLPTVRTSLTLVVALYAGTVAVTVARAPEVALFSVGIGPWVTLVGAVVLVVALVRSARIRSTPGSAPTAS